MDASAILGTWRLVKHGRIDPLGNYISTGEQIDGFLLYSADGSMSVLITTVPNPQTLAQLIAYSGKFSVKADQITHDILVTPEPKRRNTQEIRTAVLEGNHLTLRTESKENGYYEIVWARDAKGE